MTPPGNSPAWIWLKLESVNQGSSKKVLVTPETPAPNEPSKFEDAKRLLIAELKRLRSCDQTVPEGDQIYSR